MNCPFWIVNFVETKIKMDKTMQRAETARLWPIIETLKWVLNEILEVRSEPLRAQLWDNEHSLPQSSLNQYIIAKRCFVYG
jgi:hypothetical protein